MSMSFTSEITRCTSPFTTRLTFGFFASVSLVLCAYFQQWTLKQKWMPWKQPFPCWSQVVQSPRQKLQRSPLHNSYSDALYMMLSCSENCLIRKVCRPQWWRNFHFDIPRAYTGVVRSFAASPLIYTLLVIILYSTRKYPFTGTQTESPAPFVLYIVGMNKSNPPLTNSLG